MRQNKLSEKAIATAREKKRPLVQIAVDYKFMEDPGGSWAFSGSLDEQVVREILARINIAIRENNA